MKIEKIDDDNYNVYIFSINYQEKDFNDKIKKILERRLGLNGYYKVGITNTNIGSFLQVRLIDNTLYRNNLDIKFYNNDANIYFKTTDYFMISDFKNIRYYDNYFYVLVDDSFNNTIKRVEFGNFCYECDIIDELRKTVYI